MAADPANRPSGLWVPVSRRELTELLEYPGPLRLYFLLCDETYRARWQYGEDYSDQIYYRGMVFEFVEPHTFLFDLPELAEVLRFPESHLVDLLKVFFRHGYVDALHLGVRVDEESVQAAESYGLPVSELIGTGGEYDRDAWHPAAVHMQPLTGGYLRMPKEAGDVPADMLRFLVAVYLRARYRDKSTVFYKGKYHTLQAGELLLSTGELAEQLSVHREQVHRWATYAVRDGLLKRTPHGRDYRWQVIRYARKPRG